MISRLKDRLGEDRQAPGSNTVRNDRERDTSRLAGKQTAKDGDGTGSLERVAQFGERGNGSKKTSGRLTMC